jgi:hypothetical protein
VKNGNKKTECIKFLNHNLGFFYHYAYLKMIFDPRLWEKEAIAIFASTVAALYATLLVCVYVSFVFTELVTFPNFKVTTQTVTWVKAKRHF